MNMAVEEAQQTKRNVAKYVGIQTKEDHIFCVEDQGATSFFVNTLRLVRLMVKFEMTTKRWDYITTFKPPRYLSLEPG